jgi:hypothetical protein
MRGGGTRGGWDARGVGRGTVKTVPYKDEGVRRNFATYAPSPFVGDDVHIVPVYNDGTTTKIARALFPRRELYNPRNAPGRRGRCPLQDAHPRPNPRKKR